MWKESVSFISPSGKFGQKGKHPGLDWAERENSRISLGASISDLKNSTSLSICPDQ